MQVNQSSPVKHPVQIPGAYGIQGTPMLGNTIEQPAHMPAFVGLVTSQTQIDYSSQPVPMEMNYQQRIARTQRASGELFQPFRAVGMF